MNQRNSWWQLPLERGTLLVKGGIVSSERKQRTGKSFSLDDGQTVGDFQSPSGLWYNNILCVSDQGPWPLLIDTMTQTRMAKPLVPSPEWTGAMCPVTWTKFKSVSQMAAHRLTVAHYSQVGNDTTSDVGVPQWWGDNQFGGSAPGIHFGRRIGELR